MYKKNYVNTAVCIELCAAIPQSCLEIISRGWQSDFLVVLETLVVQHVSYHESDKFLHTHIWRNGFSVAKTVQKGSFSTPQMCPAPAGKTQNFYAQLTRRARRICTLSFEPSSGIGWGGVRQYTTAADICRVVIVHFFFLPAQALGVLNKQQSVRFA